MSEFRREWPQTEDPQDQLKYIQNGLDVIKNQLVLPSDKRWDIAYGALVMGGLESSVFSEGETSTGKSEWGNVVLGAHRRVDIVATDTVGTLEGVESVVTHKTTKPKILVADEADVALFLDEISHLRDTGPLHKYWTGNVVMLPNGQVLDMRNAVIYSTANLYEGGRSKKLDSAIRARLGINILAGDGGEAHAKKVSDFVQPELADEYLDGLLPYAKQRQDLRENMEYVAPQSQEGAEFMIDVISAANESGLLNRIDLSNKRQLKSWVQAVRAQRLVDPESALKGPITPKDLARVAALGIGSVATLSSAASEQIADAIGKVDVLSPLEKAIFARRAVAGVAMRTLIESMDITVDVSKDADIARFIDRRSYVQLLDSQAEAGDEVIVDTLLDRTKKAGVHTNEQTKRGRIFKRNK